MDILKEYISFFLNEEKDENIEMESVDNLALVIDPARHATTFILYDPKYYAQKMKKDIYNAFKQFKSISLKGDQFNTFKNFYSFTNVQDIFVDTEGIYGYLNVNMGRTIGIEGSCYDANEIRAVAARKGYGMIMYLIALSVESPIMPNRDNVSDDSKEFWRYISTQKDKVETNNFTDEDQLHKKTEKDCEVYHDPVLDQSFSIKKPIQLKKLAFKHKVFLDQMKEFFEKHQVDFIKSRVSEYIVSSGKLFFDRTEYME